MKIDVTFDRAPDAAEWAAVLADDGWKITQLTTGQLTAEKFIGNDATYPPRKQLHWYFSVKEIEDNGISVTVEVPVFADSIFSMQRLLEAVSDYVQKVDGDYETETAFELPLLDELRQ